MIFRRMCGMNFHRMRYLGALFVTFVVSQSVLRLVLFLSSFDSVSLRVGEVGKTFALGLGYDACSALFFVLPPALLLLILPTSWLNRKWGRGLVLGAGFLMNFLLAFSSASLFFFWQEFHTNFNFIAVDYLIYTTEMLGNIVEAYPVGVIIPVLLLAAGGLAWWQDKYLQPPFRQKEPRRLALEGLLILLILTLVTTNTRDDWREKVSPNQYNIELSGNGPYGFVHAFFANELDYHQFYPEEDRSLTLFRLRQLLAAPNASYVEDDGIRRRVENDNGLSMKKPHIVFITVESLSSDYCGAFGGAKSYTPHLDELAGESFIFTRMYATGTRTVRGLEALSLSVPPTPGQSILRRPGTENLSTLGEALRQNGYARDFVYGGYGYFDNMNGFFSGNGYTIRDRVDIPQEEVIQETAWGVADEVLFTQVMKALDEHEAKGERALEMVMTTTNHSPYTFPEGRVDAPQGVRESAVLYTDWAIWDFLQRAREMAWFDHTVFVIVADHQSRAAGKAELPISRYHIPCLIYAPGLIEPEQTDRLISQMDLAPTLLGMLGLSYEASFMGRDIFHSPESGDRAFISTYQSMGYVKGDKLIILKPGKHSETYEIEDFEQSRYRTLPRDEALEQEAITWYQGASDLFAGGKLKGGK